MITFMVYVLFLLVLSICPTTYHRHVEIHPANLTLVIAFLALLPSLLSVTGLRQRHLLSLHRPETAQFTPLARLLLAEGLDVREDLPQHVHVALAVQRHVQQKPVQGEHGWFLAATEGVEEVARRLEPVRWREVHAL